MVYAVIVWLASGLFGGEWWIQFFCFFLAAFLMMELNTIHALIRIYSRMVSCVFIILLCMICFLFPSIPGAITQICVIAATILLFNGYQDKTSTGWTFYSFLPAHSVVHHALPTAIIIMAYMDGITSRHHHALLVLVLLAGMERRFHTTLRPFPALGRFQSALQPFHD